METKVWYQSKTILVNALVILLAVGTFLLDQNHSGALPFSLDPRWVVFGIGLGNIGLRFLSDKPVTLSNNN